MFQIQYLLQPKFNFIPTLHPVIYNFNCSKISTWKHYWLGFRNRSIIRLLLRYIKPQWSETVLCISYWKNPLKHDTISRSFDRLISVTYHILHKNIYLAKYAMMYEIERPSNMNIKLKWWIWNEVWIDPTLYFLCICPVLLR